MMGPGTTSGFMIVAFSLTSSVSDSWLLPLSDFDEDEEDPTASGLTMRDGRFSHATNFWKAMRASPTDLFILWIVRGGRDLIL